MGQLRYATYRTLRRGETTDYDSLFDEVLPNINPHSDYFSCDLDGTLFHEDLGVLVFVKKLVDPHFWKFSVENFRRLLLPKKYIKVFEAGLEGSISGLAPSTCQDIFNLTEDLTKLYEEQKGLVDAGAQFHQEDPVMNEFALRMLALGKIIMGLEGGVLGPIMNYEFLSRTRFFARQNQDAVSRLTQEVVRNSQPPEIRLDSDPSLAKGLHLSYSGELLKPRLITLGATIRRETHAVISRLKSEKLIIPAITTANLEPTAKAAVRHTEYDKIFSASNVWGSHLSLQEDDKLGTKMEGLPVQGPRKVDRITSEIRDISKLKGAMGDTEGDMEQLVAALQNRGVALFVSYPDDPEKSRIQVREGIKRVLGISTIQKAQQILGKGWENRMIFTMPETS